MNFAEVESLYKYTKFMKKQIKSKGPEYIPSLLKEKLALAINFKSILIRVILRSKDAYGTLFAKLFEL